jgi:hypothetical protein
MQHVDFELNPKAFLKKHGARLEAHAAEHNVILSMCQAAERQMARGGEANMRFVTLFEDMESGAEPREQRQHPLSRRIDGGAQPVLPRHCGAE